MKSTDISQYLKEVGKLLATGVATEHTYRPALQQFVETLGKEITAINEPKRVKCGAPDFVVNRGETPQGYIEAKDIGKNLDEVEQSEQIKRYFALGNLILTDYLEFRLYSEGERRMTVRLASVGTQGRLRKESDGIEKITQLFDAFLSAKPPTISNPKELATRMATLARQIQNSISGALEDEDKGGSLHDQMEGFRDALLHNLKPDEFADMYAQTICYGLFSARCEYQGKEPFTRQKAAFELPKTNPFLRKMFGHMAGPELDSRVVWIVDNLAELLNRADMEAILKDFGKRTGHKDPILHFYETFLAAYDPKMREARGVYYTPEQVVSYIVRSVDHILKTDFHLLAGLADSSKVTGKLSTPDKTGKPKTEECHKVLILDPAVGTGTFLHTIIDHIHEYIVSKRQGGMWSGYVSKHLLPRIFGFELLMAPYTITHMKLSLQLKDKKYDFSTDERLGVFLTNTLEEAFHITEALPFTRWITEEANAASEVKRDKPVMVVIGNPPYSGHSQTPNERQRRIDPGQKYEVDTKLGRKTRIAKKTMYRKEKTFIGNLIQDYFHVDGKRLREQNPKYLYDDYVKFIRFAQWRIQQTGYGVLAFITNHGYLDNPTFRGMRQNLMNTFDDIYVLNLHGNIRKKEVCPDGSKDENVFDIEQGVAIGIFVKRLRDRDNVATVAQVHHADLWGLREVRDKQPDSKSVLTETKYGWLAENSLDTTEWTKLKPDSPFYLFVPQDTELREEYERGWKVTDCMPLNSTGIKTHRDHFVLDFDYKSLHSRIHDFRNLALPDIEMLENYDLHDTRDWRVSQARRSLAADQQWETHFVKCLYRPFDQRCYYHSKDVVELTREEVMHHMLAGENLALLTCRQQSLTGFHHVLCSKTITECCAVSIKTREITSVFPLYLYPKLEKGDLFDTDKPAAAPGGRKPNLAPEFIKQLSQKLKLKFIPDGIGDLRKTYGPEDIFHYMYAVFHSPAYRTRYADFLKIDFPRLPLTSQRSLFRALCKLGEQLIGLHLMEKHGPELAGYPEAGDDKVEKVRYTEPVSGGKQGKVWINKKQFFENVPPEIWEFHIGGYQVCQKWLKDRKGRMLSHADLAHYQQIVSALAETIRLMSAIDQAIDKHGGWPIT